MSDASYSCCVSCGTAEVDDIKLKDCDGCDLVKYCSDECQLEHKSDHEEDCKKRAAELRDELLFKQPEGTHKGDCPICSLPQPLDPQKSIMMRCCSKTICKGCFCANMWREVEASLVPSCPFCRKPTVTTLEEMVEQNLKRAEMNDPVALCQEGIDKYDKGEYLRAFEYYTKASELGHAEAHYYLGSLYRDGEGVEKDEGKTRYHFEEAAIGGHPDARFKLGCFVCKDDNTKKAVKHWIIAATQGDDNSMETLIDAFKGGFVSKEDLAAVLRAHKNAVDATKSPQREAVKP